MVKLIFLKSFLVVVRPEGYVGLVPARSDSELVLAAALSLSLRDTRENVLENAYSGSWIHGLPRSVMKFIKLQFGQTKTELLTVCSVRGSRLGCELFGRA